MADTKKANSNGSIVKTVLTYLFGFISGLVVVIVFYPILISMKSDSEKPDQNHSNQKIFDEKPSSNDKNDKKNVETFLKAKSKTTDTLNFEISKDTVQELAKDSMLLIIAARPMPYVNSKTREVGVIITNIDTTIPAHKISGLQKNDVLLSVNQQKLNSIEQALELGREMKENFYELDTVSVEILRDGRKLTLEYKLL